MVRRARNATLTALGIAGALTIASATPADAALLLYADIDGTTYCAADDNTGCVADNILLDENLTTGILDLGSGTVGPLQVSGSFHQQTISSGVGGNNILASGSSSIVNNSGATVNATVIVSATGFLGPATAFETSGSGTFTSAQGSDITMWWYNDPTNEQGAETATDTPGNLVDGPFAFAPPDASESFSHNATGGLIVPDDGLFSMTLAFQLELVAGGSLTSRGQNEIKPTAVPEPATMALLGFGLLGAGLARRRR